MIYDAAHALANEMRASEEYTNYCAAKEKAFEDDMSKDLYNQFKKLSMTVNAAVMAGQQLDEETQQKYQQMLSLLSLNPKLNEFMIAEHRLNLLIGDVFKILADAVEMDLSFLGE